MYVKGKIIINYLFITPEIITIILNCYAILLILLQIREWWFRGRLSMQDNVSRKAAIIFLECLLVAIRFPPSREGRRLISGVVLWYTFLQIWSNDKRNFSCRSVRIRTRTRPRIGFVHSQLSYMFIAYRYVFLCVCISTVRFSSIISMKFGITHN